MVKSHVIPAGFFRRLRSDDQIPRLLANNEDDYPKRAPAGIYDDTILCSVCEPLFGEWDQYAQEVMTDVPLGEPQKVGAQVVGYELADWRYQPLKLFFVSLAWRASMSVHSFYRRIRLGPYESRARAMLEQRRPGSPQEFAVTLAKFTDPLGKALFDPHPEKWEGVNYVRFYLAGYVAYIKIDRRPAPKPMSDFLLTPGAPLKIVGREFMRSSELSLAKSIVAQPKNSVRRPS